MLFAELQARLRLTRTELRSTPQDSFFVGARCLTRLLAELWIRVRCSAVAYFTVIS